jgi:PAS domain S-box-containing protein
MRWLREEKTVPAPVAESPRSGPGERSKLRVLIIEDSPDDAEILVHTLGAGWKEIFSLCVETASAFVDALTTQVWDIIISDYSLPSFSAPRALSILGEKGITTPLIVISGVIEDEKAASLMRAGARDFLSKSRLERLIPAIERELAESAMLAEREKARERFIHEKELADSIIRCLPGVFYIFDESGKFLRWNDNLERVTGRQAGEVASSRPEDFIHPDDRAMMKMQMVRAFREGKSSSDFRILAAGNATVPYHFSSVRTSIDGVPCLIGTGMDISEQIKAGISLRRKMERLKAMSLIDRLIASNFDISLSLAAILTHLTLELGVSAVSILHSDRDKGELVRVAGFGLGEGSGPGTSDTGYARRILAGNDSVILTTGGHSDLELPSTLMSGNDFGGYAAGVLVAHGEKKGILEVFQRGVLEVDEEWMEFFSDLAGRIAVAMENAEMFDSLHKKSTELLSAYDETIEGWSRALELRDRETMGHTRRVAEISCRIAELFDISGEEIIQMRRGALLHDIGKMGVPDRVLHKPGPLDAKEWAVMKKHPEFAFQLLEPIEFLRPALDIPYCHHERWDGNGYPRQLKGEEIPLGARIFSVVDVWDALRSDRPYRKAWTKEETIAHIRSCSGTLFDPEVVRVILDSGLLTVETAMEPGD